MFTSVACLRCLIGICQNKMQFLLSLLTTLVCTTTVQTGDPCPDIFEIDDHCEQYNEYGSNFVCPCRKAGCYVSVTLRKCVYPQQCSERFGQCKTWKKGTCLRAGVHYSDGGVLCENKVEQGSCSISDVLVGKKAGLEVGEILLDSRDVTYVHVSNFIDPGGIRTTENGPDNPKCNLDKISHIDKQLFIKQTYGATSKRSPDLCLSYLLPGLRQVGPGLYEISIKFIESQLDESNWKIKRSFTVKLGDLILMEELLIGHHLRYCKPFEIIFLFEFTNQGSEEFVTVQGYPPMKYDSEQLPLSFCYGSCFPPPGFGDFMFSAFYVARLENNATR